MDNPEVMEITKKVTVRVADECKVWKQIKAWPRHENEADITQE